MAVTEFVRVRLVPLVAPWVSPGSFLLVRLRPGGRWVLFGAFRFVLVPPRDRGVRSGSSWSRCVRSGLSCSFGCVLGFAGFVRVRLVRPGVPWG